MFLNIHLQEINNWNFDVYKLQEISTGHSLKYVAKELFSRYGHMQRFRMNLDKLDTFLTAVECGYTKLKNPYHNDIHAADVAQTTHYLISSSGVAVSFHFPFRYHNIVQFSSVLAHAVGILHGHCEMFVHVYCIYLRHGTKDNHFVRSLIPYKM